MRPIVSTFQKVSTGSDQAQQLPLSVPVQSQARRVLALLDGARSQDLTPESVFHRIDEQARAFRQALNDDLGSHWFWYVPEPERHLMIDSAHFGESVDGRFPTAQEDISSAARCLALREGTACVFHLMRVLEHGLRELARHLEIRMVPTVELENWGNIIDQSESKIQEERKALNKQPKSELKNERLQFLGEIAVQFGYFKDAWRNHVSHARKSYDADQALSVWNHTKEFMQKLASLA